MARNEPTRLVCIRPGALGDTLLTLPSLALIRRAWPGCAVAFVARGDVLPLTLASALAREASAYELPVWSTLFSDDPPKARAIATSHTETPRDMLEGSAAVAWLRDDEGVVARNLAALGASPVVIAPAQPREEPAEHMALTLARGLAALGLATPQALAELRASMPVLRAGERDEQTAEAVWRSLGVGVGERVMALHPGSGGVAKRWPARHMAALARILRRKGWRPLLVEGPQDGALVAAVRNELGAAKDETPVARGLSVGALAALLARCAAYMGNDSGVTHLAGLVGLPVVALFGPTDPAIWAPLGERVRIVRATHGRMEQIAPDDVADALD